MFPCPCGSGAELDRCCGLFLAGQAAPTAEALMRSRYTAYVLGNLDYIEQTDTPEAQEAFNRLDMERSLPEIQWLNLVIDKVVKGGVDDDSGQVDFTFRYITKGKEFTQREIADFRRSNGVWLYHDSEVNPKEPPAHVVQIGRNDPCSCGSGKKYKKCCGI